MFHHYFFTKCSLSSLPVPEADYFWFGGVAPEKSALGGGGASTGADFFSFGGGGGRKFYKQISLIQIKRTSPNLDAL
jgi:hypothetical protein